MARIWAEGRENRRDVLFEKVAAIPIRNHHRGGGVVGLNVAWRADAAERFPQQIAGQQRNGRDGRQERRKENEGNLYKKPKEPSHDLQAAEIGTDVEAAADLDPA